MPYRLPTSVPQSLPEFWERFREYVRQTEPVILEHIRIGTEETVVPHGLGEVPGWIAYDSAHSLSLVRQTRIPTKTALYLRAVKECVISIRVDRAKPARPPGSVANGGFHLPDWDPAGDDSDHLVKSSNTDATTVGGLVEKTEAGSNVTLTEVTTDGVKKLRITSSYSQPAPSVLLPLPDGDAALGSEGKWADGQHVHPRVDPELESSYLYPAKIPGLAWASCATVFGGYIHPWGNGWTETAPGSGVWNRDAVGSLTDAGVVTAFFAGVTPTLDMRVFSTYSMDAPWRMYDGIYTVTDLGSESTHGQVTRATDADATGDFEAGKQVQITGGSGYTNHVFGYTGPALPFLDTSLLTFEDLGIITPNDGVAYELLSSAEITTRGASSSTLELSATATAGSANMETEDGNYDFSTVGALPDVLPAGPVTFYLRGVRLIGSAGNGVENAIICQLCDDDGVGGLSVVATQTTQHIDWTVATDVACQGAIAVDYELTPGHVLTLRYLFYTDSTTAVSCSFTYNSADRITKVKTTWQNSVVGGTNWHPDLLGRDQPDQHPWSSITDDFGTATVVAGMLTMPAGKRNARVTGASVYGVDTTGFVDGDEIWLFFSDASPTSTRMLASNNGSVVDPVYAIGLPPLAGGTTGQNYTMRAPSLVRLWLDTTGHCWRPSAWPPAGSSEVGT